MADKIGNGRERRLNVNLSKVQISPFSTNQDEWKTFSSMFKNVILSKETLSNTNKFYYLKGYLIDSVTKLVQELKKTNSNYLAVWVILEDNFENKTLKLYNNLKNLFEL